MLHQFGTTCNQDSRRTLCAWLLQWTDTHSVRLDDGLRKEILDGFPKGDDVFDAVVGLFGMLKVRLGQRRSTGEPNKRKIRQVEDWILGRKVCTGSVPAKPA